ncbi:MAG: HAMP domain-containing sensor histidine kinase, partial [Bacillota bacterium]|nr:HAMP domain-containing sensor histidine kinase [Bacillota bacterium]
MKGYFINNELKKSTAVLISMMFLFLLTVMTALRFHHQQLKQDYIERMGVVTLRLLQKDPKMEKEIMPLITREISVEEVDEGQALLKQYGLTTGLEDTFFPYVNKAAGNNYVSIALIFTVFSSILFTFNYYQHGFFYKRIRNLTQAAKMVIEGDFDITIYENREGDLSKLAVAFNSMKEIIRENISDLKKEKQFLADILSDISHQLKTPLASLLVYNDILLHKRVNEEERHTFLENSQNNLYRMRRLIFSLLKLAKLDAKAIQLDKEELSLNETIQEVVDTMESKAQEGKVKIVFQEKGEVYFNHDRLWLEEALINIVKNGIEHTPEGGSINVRLTETPVYRRIEIEDTGEGIREEDLPKIF